MADKAYKRTKNLKEMARELWAEQGRVDGSRGLNIAGNLQRQQESGEAKLQANELNAYDELGKKGKEDSMKGLGAGLGDFFKKPGGN